MAISVELKVDDQKVAGNLYSPVEDSKNVGILFLHGWTGRPNEWGAEFLVQHGYTVLTIQMRGHGDSDGDIKQIRAVDSLNDAIAAYNFLTEKLPPKSPIVVIGNSYGGYIAVLLSEHRELAGLSLRVPAAYPDEIFSLPKWGRGHDDPEVDTWRQQSHDYHSNHGFNLLHDFAGKIQILEAEKDEIVPHQTVQNYVKAVSDGSRLDYKVLKDWPHSMGDDSERINQLQTILLEWLNEL